MKKYGGKKSRDTLPLIQLLSKYALGLWKLEKFSLAVRKWYKGIVSRDFGGLQMILMNNLRVPDVPLEDYSFLNLHLHIVF